MHTLRTFEEVETRFDWNSNISHGNCIKFNLNLAAVHTLYLSEKKNYGRETNKRRKKRTTQTKEKKTYTTKFNHQLSNNYLVKKLVEARNENDAFHARNKTINTFDRRTLQSQKKADEKKKSMVNNWHQSPWETAMHCGTLYPTPSRSFGFHTFPNQTNVLQPKMQLISVYFNFASLNNII